MQGTSDRGIGFPGSAGDQSGTAGTLLQPSAAYMDDSEERDSSPLTFRDSTERPIIKLSVRLIDTYKNINKAS